MKDIVIYVMTFYDSCPKFFRDIYKMKVEMVIPEVYKSNMYFTKSFTINNFFGREYQRDLYGIFLQV